MRVVVPAVRPLLLLLCFAACGKAPLVQPRPDASSPDLATAASPDLATAASPDLGSKDLAIAPDGLLLSLPEAGGDRPVQPDTDPLLCLSTMSAQELSGFPLDWATARNATAWCAFGPSQEWIAIEDGGAYNQVVLEIYVGGEMGISYETVFLYDSKTGKFVQQLSAGWGQDGVTCLLRTPDAPRTAAVSSIHYVPGGVSLGILCAPKGDAGTVPICAEVTGSVGGPAAACPCVRIGGAPAPAPDGIVCATAQQTCSYVPKGCGIVSCTCETGDAGLHWTCMSLLC
jgi:hypothetical protein